MKHKIMMLLISSLLLAGTGYATPDKETAASAIRTYLNAKSKDSGTLDIFDDSATKVRNLRVTDNPDAPAPANPFKQSYLDINSGEMVEIEFIFNDQNTVDSVKILNVEKPAPVAYTDDQIRDFIKKDIEVKSKLSGTMSLFDPQLNALRDVKFLELKDGVKKFGDLYICRVEFQDVKTNEILSVDMQAKYEKWQLSIVNVFIRDKKAAQ